MEGNGGGVGDGDGGAFDFGLAAFAVAVRRTPIATPVRTSFGVMRDRPAVFLRVSDGAGRHGYGEVWCNFPTVAAEHRARLAQEVVGPLLLTLPPAAGGQVFAELMARLHVLALQSGEWGPLRQVSAGFDVAVHDLAARRAGVPLYRLLGGAAAGPQVRVYASGIGPERPFEMATAAAGAGHAAFKVKVGFGRETDLAALRALRRAVGAGVRLMMDANQGWTLDQALARSVEYAAFAPDWLEEPLRADRPSAEWRRLAAASPVPLAAGENLGTMADFSTALEAGSLRVIQPDLAKWGGVSGCLDVARRAAGRGISYCPHFLGGGVGLLASAHLLAAQGGDGLLEMDVNPDPLREKMIAGSLTVRDGTVRLPDAPGLGREFGRLFD